MQIFSAICKEKLTETIDKVKESKDCSMLDVFSGIGACFCIEDIPFKEEDDINYPMHIALNSFFDMHPNNETIILFFDISYKLAIYRIYGERSAPNIFIYEATDYMRRRLIAFNKEKLLLNSQHFHKYFGVIWGMITTLISSFDSRLFADVLKNHLPSDSRTHCLQFVRMFESVKRKIAYDNLYGSMVFNSSGISATKRIQQQVETTSGTSALPLPTPLPKQEEQLSEQERGAMAKVFRVSFCNATFKYILKEKVLDFLTCTSNIEKVYRALKRNGIIKPSNKELYAPFAEYLLMADIIPERFRRNKDNKEYTKKDLANLMNQSALTSKKQVSEDIEAFFKIKCPYSSRYTA